MFDFEKAAMVHVTEQIKKKYGQCFKISTRGSVFFLFVFQGGGVCVCVKALRLRNRTAKPDPSRNAQLLPWSPSNEELMDAARRWMDVINHRSEWEEEGERANKMRTLNKTANSPPSPPPPSTHPLCCDLALTPHCTAVRHCWGLDWPEPYGKDLDNHNSQSDWIWWIVSYRTAAISSPPTPPPYSFQDFSHNSTITFLMIMMTDYTFHKSTLQARQSG